MKLSVTATQELSNQILLKLGFKLIVSLTKNRTAVVV